ncbi:MAG TPA: hypothetical protein VKZ96_18270 [Thermomicrobiales bacterium]|nr:hypothetical protein [Thermomicrobiales bacterium]
MSGLLAKIKSLITPDRANQAADAIEKNVTDQRVDQAMGRVPGADRFADRVPDNVGEKAADTIRDQAGGGERGFREGEPRE